MKIIKSFSRPKELLKRTSGLLISGLMLLGMLPVTPLLVNAETDYNADGQFGIWISEEGAGLNLEGLDETLGDEWGWGDFSIQPYWKNDPEHEGKLIPGSADDYTLKYENNILYLKGVNLVVTTNFYNNAIWTNQDLTIEIEDGESFITCNGEIAVMTEGNLTFQGNGNLTITANGEENHAAILANNQVTHNGSGTITLNSAGGASGINWSSDDGGQVMGTGNWAGTKLEWDDSDITGRIIYTDGELHLGYSGCYMMEDEYNESDMFFEGYPDWMWNMPPILWVHGSTIQEVIDKLSGKEEITIYDSLGNASGLTIGDFYQNHIYIAVSTSNYIANRAIAEVDEQHITSTRDFEGIVIKGGFDYQMTNHPKEGNYLVEDVVYELNKEIVDLLAELNQSYNLNAEIDIASTFPAPDYDTIPGYISRYQDDLYVAVPVTPTAENPYAYNLGDKITSVNALYEAVVQYNSAHPGEEISIENNILMEWMRMTIDLPFSTLHINSSCDFKIAGQFNNMLTPVNEEGINVYFGFLPDTNHSITFISDVWGGDREFQTYTKADIDSLQGVLDIPINFLHPNKEGNQIYIVRTKIYQHITDGSVSGDYATLFSADMNNNSIPDAKLLANVDITDEQLDILEGGGAVDIDLSINQIDENAAGNRDAVADIEKALENNTKGYSNPFYLDFNLSASIRDAGNNRIPFDEGKNLSSDRMQIALTELEEPVELTVAIPTQLISQRTDIEYAVVRRHVDANGQVQTDIIPVTHNKTAGTLTFETDRFSTYAIVSNAAPSSTPATGDTAALAWVAALLVLSMGIGVATVAGKQK